MEPSEPQMWKLWATVAMALMLSGAAPARADGVTSSEDGSPRVGMFVGYGGSAGGFGAGAEVYLAHSRVSLFAAMGFVPRTHDGRSASGEAAAGGLRVFAGGRRHRAFAEVSLAPAGRDVAPQGSGLQGEHITYGPGLSLGYHFVGSGGFTFMVSGGVAYGMTGPDRLHHGHAVSTAALGYTWRRQERRVDVTTRVPRRTLP